MFSYLRYLALSLFYPARRDFLKAGLGIASRHKRCARYWKPHLELSKQFISSALQNARPATVVILGAGRLLDVPISDLSEKTKQVVLVDWDPGVTLAWENARRTLEARGVTVATQQSDVTGRLTQWTKALDSLPVTSSASDARELLVSLVELPALETFPEGIRADLLISLNLLSQLGLYWEDRVRSRLGTLMSDDGIFSDSSLEKALQSTMRCLEEEHLSLLSNSEAETIVLLSDEWFHYYRQQQSEWRTDAALRTVFPPALANYSIIERDSWLWHLAPQWLEQLDYGEIHTVRALRYQKHSSSS